MWAVCIDDEPLALEAMEVQLGKRPEIKQIDTFMNPHGALDYILNNDIDVVFTDIQMPELGGIELATRLLQEKPMIFIVFITAHKLYAVEGFELNVIDYLVKPIKDERLNVTIKRIQKQREIEKTGLFNEAKLLNIRTTPHLAFELEPNESQTLRWRTAKTQELFVYLLQNNHILIEKSLLIDLLWEDVDYEKAFQLLYTTISYLRNALKPFADYIYFERYTEGYMLKTKHVRIDINEWEKDLQSLGRVNARNINQFEKAMEKNRGRYLEYYDYTWLEGEKYRLDSLWIYTAKKMAAVYFKQNNVEKTVEWYQKIISRFPTMEDIHFALMKVYYAHDEFYLMMQQYDHLKKTMKKEFYSDPREDIVEWYVGTLK